MCLHHVPTCGCPKMALNEKFWVSRQKLINRKKIYIRYDKPNGRYLPFTQPKGCEFKMIIKQFQGQFADYEKIQLTCTSFLLFIDWRTIFYFNYSKTNQTDSIEIYTKITATKYTNRNQNWNCVYVNNLFNFNVPLLFVGKIRISVWQTVYLRIATGPINEISFSRVDCPTFGQFQGGQNQ